MRRKALLTVGVCALLGLTGAGVAGATSFGTEQPRTIQRASVDAPGLRLAHDAPGAEEPGAETIGTLESVKDGTVDRLGSRRSRTLRYPGADYVKVHFARMDLAAADKVRVADAKGEEAHSYTSNELRDAGNWSMSVSGDTAVVSVESAGKDPMGLRGKLAGLGVTVDQVARGQNPGERAAADAKAKAEAASQPHVESICGHSDEKEDAVCYKSSDPVAYTNSKPVARVLINGIELCTAWRVGPSNRMLTNHHCFTTTPEARNTEVWFGYECGRCGGANPLPATKVSGDQVLATDSVLDYTLFSVRNFASIQRFGYLQIDNRAPVRGEQLYIPQHPRGAPTMIAIADTTERSGNCEVASATYDGYDTGTDMSYYCDTEGGSSGSPVLSRRTNRVIALHHFGGCPNSGVRMDLINEQIGSLL